MPYPWKSYGKDVEKAIEDIDLDAPELPEPETPLEPEDWLFDSARDYEEQLVVYKERKNGKAAEEEEED